MRRILSAGLLFLGLGVFAGLVVLSGPEEIWKAAGALPLWALGLLFLLELLGLSFWAASWGALLWAAGIRAQPTEILGAALAGYAVSYLTPVSYLGGEPVRGWLIAKRTGSAPLVLAGTLLWDRVIAGLVLFLFALTGAGMILPLLSSAQRILGALGLGVLGTALGLAALSFAGGWGWLSRIFLGLSRFSWNLRPRLALWAEKIGEMERAMHQAFRHHVGAVLLAFIFQILSFLCHYLRPLFYFGVAQGRGLSLRELGVYFNLNAFLSLFLWLTPAGVGTAEGGRVGILGLLGISPAEAMAFSLTYRFLELVLVGIGLAVIVRAGAGPKVWRGLGVLRGLAEVGNLLVYGIIIPARVLPRFFERRFRRPDPWNYDQSPYERRKYELMLAILPRRGYRRALDLGCAEGLFTRRLVDSGVAQEAIGVDVSSRAVARAQARCADLARVEFHHLDIRTSLPEGEFDLVFCSEVLYYLGYWRIRSVAEKLAEKVLPGGHVVLVSAWPAARVIHRPFLRHPAFKLVAEHVERDPARPYAITCLERLP